MQYAIASNPGVDPEKIVVELKLENMLATVNGITPGYVYPQEKITALANKIQEVLDQMNVLNTQQCTVALAECEADLAQLKKGETPLASFHFVSDVHLENSDASLMESLLKGMASINPDTNIGIVFAGDNTDDGEAQEFEAFYKTLQLYSPVAAENIALVLGNHDTRDGRSSSTEWLKAPINFTEEGDYFSVIKERFLTYNAPYMPEGTEEVYYAKKIGGYTFIMLNTEMPLRGGSYMTEAQLAWLEETVAAAYAEDPTRPIFIVHHQPLADTHLYSTDAETIYMENLSEEYKGLPESEVTDAYTTEMQLEANALVKEILDKYPTSIWLSGHSHNSFGTSVGVVRHHGAAVEAPSARKSSVYGGGFEVQIYDGAIVFRAINYLTGEYLPQYDITIQTGENNVSAIYQEAQQVLADADSYDATEIANIETLSDTLHGLINVYEKAGQADFYKAEQHAEINTAAQNLRTALRNLSVVVPAEGVDITLSAGEVRDLVVQGATDWESGDESVVTVDANGRLTALKKGTTTVTVTTAGGTITCNVTVTLDTSAISDAILSANTLKANVAIEGTIPCAKLYASAEEIEALTDAVAAAETNMAAATTNAEVESIAQALNDALDTFRGAIQTGTIDHEGEHACSTDCKYGCGTVIPDAMPHAGASASATTCLYCGAAITVTDTVSLTVGDDTTYYASLGDAVDAANIGGGTITLLDDVTVTEQIVLKKSVTIDGNGKSISAAVVNAAAILVKSNFDLTVKNLTLENTEQSGIDIDGSGTLTIESSTVKSANVTIELQDFSGDCVIDNSIIEGKARAIRGKGNNLTIKDSVNDAVRTTVSCTTHTSIDLTTGAWSKVVIENATVAATTASGTRHAIILDTVGTLEMTNATITTSAEAIGYGTVTEKITVKNSEITTNRGGINLGGNGSAELLIEDTEIVAPSTNGSFNPIRLSGFAKATVKNTTITAGNANNAIYATATPVTLSGSVSVSGTNKMYIEGTLACENYTGLPFAVKADSSYSFYATLNEALAGGTSLGSVRIYSESAANDLSDEYTVTEVTENGATYYKLVGDVAQIGNDTFKTLEQAIAAATGGDIITLLDDVTITAQIVLEKSITINGNGKKISVAISASKTAAILVQNNADFTIKNLTLQYEKYSGIEMLGSGLLTIENSTVTSGNVTIELRDFSGDCVIDNSTIEGYARAIRGKGNNLTIKDSVNDAVRTTISCTNDRTIDLTGTWERVVIENATVASTTVAGKEHAISIGTVGTIEITNATITASAEAISGGTVTERITVKNSEITTKRGGFTLSGNGSAEFLVEGKKIVATSGDNRWQPIRLSNFAKVTVKDVALTAGNVNAIYITGSPVTLSGNVTVSGSTKIYIEGALTFDHYTGTVFAARTGSTCYTIVEQAISAASEGDTVTLLADVNAGALTLDKAITLDLGGKTLTAAVSVDAGVTVKNGTVVATAAAFTLADGATLALNGLTVTADSILAGVVGGNVTTDNATLAGVLNAQGYSVTRAQSVYTVTGLLDFTAIDGALDAADTAKEGILIADKACVAGVGNGYVFATEMQALINAITIAEQAKASAMNNDELANAVSALNGAVTIFQASIKEGIAHTDSATDNDHVCDYDCGEKLNDCVPNADDGDCTTAVTCTVCGEITTAAKTAHTPGADDGDCTTAVGCTECDQVAVAAKAAHTPGADDGDCTTAITCTECGTVTTAAKASHTGGSATCTAKATCSVCGKVYGELAQHIYDGDTDASCNVCGAERTVANNTNGNENNANGNENNAQNGNTEAPAKKGLSGGAVAGIVIGAVTILGGTGFALFWFVIRKKKA